MSKHDELMVLEQKAILVMSLTNREERQRGGFHLENEARKLDDQYRILGGIDEQAEIKLRAVIKIIFEYILYDALEDKDWVETLPEAFSGDVSELLRGIR